MTAALRGPVSETEDIARSDMSVKVSKLGFIGLNCVNIDEMKNHYANVIGLAQGETGDDGSTYFACGFDHHAVGLVPSKTAGIHHLGLEVGGVDSMQDVVKALEADGVKAELRSDAIAGVKELVKITDPDGAAIYLYKDMATSREAYGREGIVPDKIGHVAYFVENAERSADFYTKTMGFKWSDWLERMFVFMRCNMDHHTVNFLQAKQRGMFHVAFELHDFTHMGRSCDELARHNIPIIWGPGRHGMGHNLFTYHRDPDGNVVEFIADLDRVLDEEREIFEPRPYHDDYPQKPKVWERSPRAANMWGVMPPPDFGAQNVGEA